MSTVLKRSSGDEVIQAFPLAEGKVGLTSADGEQTGVSLIHCVDDGSFTIEWTNGGNTDTVNAITGDDFAVKGHSILIVSGTFHIA